MADNVMDFKDRLNKMNMGKRGALVIEALRNLEPFIISLKSSVGAEILKDDILRYDELLGKVIDENINSQELAELRYVRARLMRITGRLDTYFKLLNESQITTR